MYSALVYKTQLMQALIFFIHSLHGKVEVQKNGVDVMTYNSND